MTTKRRLIVTHHAPDLDAIASVWLLKRFDSQHYGTAKVVFVDAGEIANQQDLDILDYTPQEITHVDTGKGEFDHHQPERGKEYICAASLVFDHITQIQPDKKNDKSLQIIVDFVTEIDHFREIFWPEPDSYRYSFTIHNLIRGIESIHLHDDDSMLHFGMQCLDAAYAYLNQITRAEELIEQRKQVFQLKKQKALAIETTNDDVIKVAQKQGYILVIRRDPSEGHMRIKARPDADIDLTHLYHLIKQKDSQGTWFNHPSGKMLLNSSDNNRNHTPTRLTLPEVITMIKETYA